MRHAISLSRFERQLKSGGVKSEARFQALTCFAGQHRASAKETLRVRLKSTSKPRKGLGLFASLFASQLSFQLSN